MQLSKLDQFINSLDDTDMDTFIDMMIDDNPYADMEGYGCCGSIDEQSINYITRNDINR
jgi:hypothetical protein